MEELLEENKIACGEDNKLGLDDTIEAVEEASVDEIDEVLETMKIMTLLKTFQLS